MKIETYIDSLVSYAMNTGLAEPCDHQVLTNRLLLYIRTITNPLGNLSVRTWKKSLQDFWTTLVQMVYAMTTLQPETCLIP